MSSIVTVVVVEMKESASQSASDVFWRGRLLFGDAAVSMRRTGGDRDGMGDEARRSRGAWCADGELRDAPWSCRITGTVVLLRPVVDRPESVPFSSIMLSDTSEEPIVVTSTGVSPRILLSFRCERRSLFFSRELMLFAVRRSGGVDAEVGGVDELAVICAKASSLEEFL